MRLFKLLSRAWWFTTLLVIIGTLALIRLGIWQLDRLKERRAFNAQVISARSQPAFDLNQHIPENILAMEWHAVQFSGKYDFANQVALRNQYYGTQYGYHLLTPLLSDGTAVLVDRGFIPAEGNSTTDAWRKYDETGEVKVTGQIRLGQGKPAFGGVADALPNDGSKLMTWNNADVAQIAKQMPYPVLPVYIQLNSDPSDITPPIPSQPELDLTEGPHLGYALQWFTFALILFAGYLLYFRKQESKPQ